MSASRRIALSWIKQQPKRVILDGGDHGLAISSGHFHFGRHPSSEQKRG